MLSDKRIAILGSGTMGQAIAGGLLRSEKVEPGKIMATARSKATAEKFAAEFGFTASTDSAEAARSADIILLCVKPKDIQKLIEGLKAKNALSHCPLMISIAAGISTSFIENIVGDVCP